jgi:myo-inositol 2-dehydrogenase / D-chiro-inositol 1-dehydrogenase
MVANDLVRVGLVGAGGVGERHARVLSGLPGVSVVGVADPDAVRAEALAQRCGAAAFADAATLAGSLRPDAFYVCVPPFAHGEPEAVAVEHGLPLFVEKPLATDLATAERIAVEVERAGLVTATGYHWRCLDTVQRARALLDGHPPGLLAARWLDKVPPPAWWTTWAGSGGQVTEQVTHLVDLVRHLGGEVEQVAAHGASLGHCGPGADIDEASVAVLRLAGGAVATITASCLGPDTQAASLDIVAPGLGLELSESELVVHVDGAAERVAAVVDPRLAVDTGFVSLVRGEPFPAAVGYGEALRTHRVGCALTTSAREGREVRLGTGP